MADAPVTSVPPGGLGASPNSTDRPLPVVIGGLVGFVALAQLAGLVGLPFTDTGAGSWYGQLDKPFFNPPGWAFGPVWTTLYALIGVAAWAVWRTPPSPTRRAALSAWGIQLALNAIWTPLFFGAELPWLAFVEILLLVGAIVITISVMRVIRPVAAWMMAPYLAWVSFAAVLNGTIAALN